LIFSLSLFIRFINTILYAYTTNNLQEYINLTCARNIRIKLLITGIKPPFWIRTIRFFGRVCVNNNDINRRESSNRGQLKKSPGTNVYTALCWRGGIRYSVWPDIYRGFGILVLCFSQRKEERFALVVLRAWSLFDQENAVLPLQRATFFNLFFFFFSVVKYNWIVCFRKVTHIG